MYQVKLILLLICGICWTITYIECIRVGVKQKTYAMPFLALALNFTWELYNTIQGYLIAGFHISTLINVCWVGFDIGILITYFRYGKPEKQSKTQFYIVSFLVLIISMISQYLLGKTYGLEQGAINSAFWSNLLMSVLFIGFSLKRKGIKGQSLSIAINKCLGTFAASILVGYIGINRLGGANTLILIVGLIIFVIDLYYCYLVYSKTKQLKSEMI